jgi:hypothetical protein
MNPQEIPFDVPPEAAGIFAALGVVWLLFVLGMLLLLVIVWWKLFSKAGYSGALGLLMFVPIINFIMMLFLAFSDWPVLKEVRSLRRRRGGE